MKPNIEIVFSLAKYLAARHETTNDDLLQWIVLIAEGCPSMVALAIDKGITLEELHLGVRIAYTIRLSHDAPHAAEKPAEFPWCEACESHHGIGNPWCVNAAPTTTESTSTHRSQEMT